MQVLLAPNINPNSKKSEKLKY